jgi:hypothetical protein
MNESALVRAPVPSFPARTFFGPGTFIKRNLDEISPRNLLNCRFERRSELTCHSHRRGEGPLAFGVFDIARGKRQGSSAAAIRKKQLIAMKTIEEINTGLPSFETEWPTNAETEREVPNPRTQWASGRLQHTLQSSIGEITCTVSAVTIRRWPAERQVCPAETM